MTVLPKVEDVRARIADIGWAATLPDELRSAWLARCLIVELEDGGVLYRYGDPPGGAYGLAEGGIDFALPVPGDVDHRIHIAQPGFWFGQSSSFAGLSRTTTIIARRRVTLLHIPLEDIEAVAKERPEIWRYLAALGAQHTAIAVTQIVTLLTREPLLRVAHQLLRFQSTGARSLSVTQAELAETVSLSRNTTNRVLAELSAAGAVSLGYGRVEVRDVDELRRIVEPPSTAE